MSARAPLLTCVTSAQMSGLWGGADQRLMDWRGRLLTRFGHRHLVSRVTSSQS